MAIGEGTPFQMGNCICPKTVGIGLPFDHPIWQRLSDGCPIHDPNFNLGFIQTVTVGSCTHVWRGRHLADPECSKCGKRKSEDNVWTTPWFSDVQWSYTGVNANYPAVTATVK